MPKVTPIRGRFTIVERGIDKTFMFNPNDVSDTKGVNFGEGDVAGASHPVVQFGGGKARKISFELYLDGDRGQLARGEEKLSIKREIDFYRSLEYPAKYGEGANAVAPYTVLFTMGEMYQQLPCFVEEAKVKINYWTPRMEPVRATISITLREVVKESQTVDDVYDQFNIGDDEGAVNE